MTFGSGISGRPPQKSEFRTVFRGNIFLRFSVVIMGSGAYLRAIRPSNLEGRAVVGVYRKAENYANL
jgi:hypothetical protein